MRKGLNMTRKELVMEWYELYYDDIYRFILYMLGDQQYCEDLIHDTFVRAYTAYDRFDQRSSIKTWLFSIAKHLVIDEIRRRKRKKVFMLGLSGKKQVSPFNVEQHVENKEAIIELMQDIQRLKPSYRLVIILNKVEELSTKEIANVLDWSETKVRKTLFRALQELRKQHSLKGGVGLEETT